MGKHTKEPWHVLAENCGFIEIEDENERIIAQVFVDDAKAKKSDGYMPAVEGNANARLVAASPRLYRNLKKVTERMAVLKTILQKKAPGFAKAWLNDGIMDDAREVLKEAAPAAGRKKGI